MKRAQTATCVTGLESSEASILRLRGDEDGPRLRRKELPTFESKVAEQKHVKERLAGAYRIFHKLGYDEGVSGHITVRDPMNPQAFWINPFGPSFDQITVGDLLLVDTDGNVLEGGKPGDGQIYNAAGFSIHGTIHRTRPDIHAAAHSHTLYGRAFSVLGRNIDMSSHQAGSFGEAVKLYDSFGGVVLDDSEGQRICEALGENGTAVVLQNHGILSAAQTVEATVAFYVRLEQLCESQLLADIAGGSTALGSKEVHDVTSLYGGQDEAVFQGEELYRWIDEETGGDYKRNY